MKRTLASLMVGLSFVAASYVANAASDLSQCIKIETPLDRLSCYDEKSGRTPKVKMNNTGAWGVSVTKSKMTDTTDVIIRVSSNNQVKCRRYNEENISLVVRCKERKVSVYFNSSRCFFTDTTAEFRLDKEPTFSARMGESTDHRALFHSKPKSFIKQMFDKNDLLWRVTPHSESPILAEFYIDGLKEIIDEHRDVCWWTD